MSRASESRATQLSVQEVLAHDGVLQRTIPGFVPRQAQLDMAVAVEEAVQQRSTLLVEAGTGTGKTYAYLVPALLSGLNIVVSTGSRQLQDQLYKTDLPRLMRVLGYQHCTLLKGRRNYLCIHRLNETDEFYRSQLGFPFEDLDRVKLWALNTQVGDIAELTAVAENAPVWASVTSTTENCLGSECPEFQRCFVAKARMRAQESRVVVINHYLFMADTQSDEENSLIPQADVYIIDEAHQLPDIATRFWGIEFNAHAVLEFIGDFRSIWTQDAGDISLDESNLEALQLVVRQIGLVLAGLTGRIRFDTNIESQLVDAKSAFQNTMRSLIHGLEPQLERSRAMERLLERAHTIMTEGLQLLSMQSDSSAVHWCERSQNAWSIGLTPLTIDVAFQEFMRQRSSAAWVFTSATLAIHEDFSFFADRLGLEECTTRVFASPFDYANQGLFYAPRSLPLPNHNTYLPLLIEEIRWLVSVSRGRAFVLFTSHRALKEAESALQDLPWKLLVQGQKPKHALVEDFKKSGKAVLLATGSFWEGVDVAGDALSLLIIDRLPFAPPDDPWEDARRRSLQEKGLSAFNLLQLPAAMMMLKQGAGRLIRTMEDRGVLVIADPRIYRNKYGLGFVQALPPMLRTHDRKRVEAFFQQPVPKINSGEVQ